MRTFFGSTIFCLVLVGSVALAEMTDPSAESAAAASRPKTLVEQVATQWTRVSAAIQNWWSGATAPSAPQTARQPASATETPSAPTGVDSPAQMTAPAQSAEVQNLVKELPQVEGTPRQVSQQRVEQIQQSLQGARVLQVQTQGRAPTVTQGLKMTKAGVPQYVPPAKSIKSVPRLDIGVEPQLSAKDLAVVEIPKEASVPQKAKPLPTPELFGLKELKNITTLNYLLSNPKEIAAARHGIDQVITRDVIEKAIAKVESEKAISQKPFTPMSEADLQYLAATILFDKGRYSVAMGLFQNLESDKSWGKRARFYSGICSHKMKFYTEALVRLSDSIRDEDADMAPQAFETLFSELPKHHQDRMAELVLGLKNKNLLPASVTDFANYLIAKYQFRKNKFEAAIAFAEKVSAKSEYSPSARYVMAVAYNQMDKLPKAAQLLEDLRSDLDSGRVSDKNLSALTSMALARIRFKQKQFKEAQTLYQKVDKDHAYWIPALVEQGWTQLYLDDAPGAIGNMYSLHSPFFASVFKPESYVVRAIGYLNICQYGDAYRTLSVLEKDYRPWREQIRLYLARSMGAEQNYQTLKTYLRGKSSEPVEGLPPQVLREIARRRDFLNQQQFLNDEEDERARLASVDQKIQGEKAKLKARVDRARARAAQLDVNLEKAKTDPKLAGNVEKWRNESRVEREIVAGYKYVLQTYEEGRLGAERLRAIGEKHVESDKAMLRSRAGQIIAGHLKSMDKMVEKIIDNNELLRYEVFSGSGENIRYQVAGGQVQEQGKRIPANVKPEKILHFDFDGEYWQDEIGNYRSSLEDNCPKSGK